MKPAKPLPEEPPFLSIYTPTFRRPKGLADNLRSVGIQTAAAHIEQVVVPDHVGHGIVGSLYGRLKWYAPWMRGEYVSILCDDDVLAEETVVAKVKAFAEKKNYPPVIVVNAEKAGLELPSYPDGTAPQPGEIDLCCLIFRRDIWLQHMHDWGTRYEGDYDMAMTLFNAGYEHARLPILFAIGDSRNGRPELDY